MSQTARRQGDTKLRDRQQWKCHGMLFAKTLCTRAHADDLAVRLLFERSANVLKLQPLLLVGCGGKDGAGGGT